MKNVTDEIKPYFKDIRVLKKSESWKIQLTIAINFIYSKDANEWRLMHSKSGNIEIVICDKWNDFLNNFFLDMKQA